MQFIHYWKIVADAVGPKAVVPTAVAAAEGDDVLGVASAAVANKRLLNIVLGARVILLPEG